MDFKTNSQIDVYEPATGKVYAQVPDSTRKDLDAAVQAAGKAFPTWSRTSTQERAQHLRRIACEIEKKSDLLAQAESKDTGKPLSLAKKMDIPRAAQNFHFFADAITQFSSESHTSEDFLNYTLRSPLGTVGLITPWNLPLYLLTWKIAPALASGNTVIAKPSELTPMTASLLSQICEESGLPVGVLNIVHGRGEIIGNAISEHPGIRSISFTGSTKTGAEISKRAAPLFKKLSLEMGGKNPTLIFADCDFTDAVETTVKSAFLNQGQICLCGSRIFIERKIYEPFKAALLEKTRALKIGDPLENVDQGALISQNHLEKVLSYIDLAHKEGGKTLTGGKRFSPPGRCEKGWFVEPTLIEGLPFDSRVNREEIFGPVATLIPFDDENEVVKWANSTAYGLAAMVWTQNLKRAHRMAKELQAGVVWINSWMHRDLRTPFGGMKSSGLGREGGIEALRFFTETKNISVKTV